ncbi:hypothetical protein, partial [Hydrogenovibrio marinus]
MDYYPQKDNQKLDRLVQLSIVFAMLVLGAAAAKRVAETGLEKNVSWVLVAFALIFGWHFMSNKMLVNANMSSLQVVSNVDTLTAGFLEDLFFGGAPSNNLKCWAKIPHRSDMSAVQFEIDHACDRLSVVRG